MLPRTMTAKPCPEMLNADQHGWIHIPAPAKINLFLHVLGKMADGYHALQSVFVLLNLADSLALKVRADGKILRQGNTADVPEDDDLAVRAAKVLQRETGCSLGVELAVQKHIPLGAGLGGGSSDAASVLLALNALWQTGLSRQALQDVGLMLGADVPFFIFGETAWVEGRGEKLTALPLILPDFAVLVPKIHVPTAAIFQDPTLKRDTEARTADDFRAWFHAEGTRKHPHQGGWRNDLQAVAERQNPKLLSVLPAWQQSWQQADAAAPPLMMTGSGAGYFTPLPADTDRGRQTAIMAYNSPPFLQGFFWRGRALTHHPLWACAR